MDAILIHLVMLHLRVAALLATAVVGSTRAAKAMQCCGNRKDHAPPPHAYCIAFVPAAT
jgi:hypothetical protein